MSTFPQYDPRVEEALGAPIGGLSNAVSQLGLALNLKTSTITDYTLEQLFNVDAEGARQPLGIYVAPLQYRGWLENPAPVVKKNNVVITSEASGFEIEYLGGAIVFTGSSKPIESDVITVSATYINSSSTVIEAINTKVQTLENSAKRFRGNFSTYEQLVAEATSPQQYDYAYVFGTVFDIYMWDNVNSDWKSVTNSDVEFLQAQIDELEAGKEPKIVDKKTAFNRDFGFNLNQVAPGNEVYDKDYVDVELGKLEPKIVDKKTAFNKDFGTTSETVMQGNDSRVVGSMQISDYVGDGATKSVKSAEISANGNNEYLHTALDTIVGTGVNGWFVAMFSGNVTTLSGKTVKSGTEIGITLEAGVPYSFIIVGNTINFRTGGAGLAIKVVGGLEQPTSPEENTIWLKTASAIGKYSIGYNRPLAAENGDAFLKISDLQRKYVYVDKNMSIIVSIDYCECFLNGEWIETFFSTYVNDEWSDTFIYMQGNQYEAITGGYEVQNSDASLNEILSDRLRLKWNAVTNYNYGFIQTKNTINMQNYSRLKARVKSTAGGYNGSIVGFRIDNDTATINIANTNDREDIVEMDISQVSGLKIIKMYTWAWNIISVSDVYEIWLEK